MIGQRMHTLIDSEGNFKGGGGGGWGGGGGGFR